MRDIAHCQAQCYFWRVHALFHTLRRMDEPDDDDIRIKARPAIIAWLHRAIAHGESGSPSALARDIGVAPSTLNRYLAGASHVISLTTILKISSVTGLSICFEPRHGGEALVIDMREAGMRERFAKRLQERRLESSYGDDRDAMAAACGIHPRRYAQIEDGRVSPGIAELRALAQTLGSSLDYLISGRIGTAPPEPPRPSSTSREAATKYDPAKGNSGENR